MVRDGNIRPNTPISQNYAKDDGWKFTDDAFDIMSNQFGTKGSEPWSNEIFSKLYPSYSDEMNSMFGCAQGSADCKDNFSRFVTAMHWYCNTRWAYSGELKNNPDKYGAIYPMQWGYPNCDKDPNGENTKTCHCSEGPWIKGSRSGQLGLNMKRAWIEFYKTGKFSNNSNIVSWQEMNFNAFNVIDESQWTQSPVLEWNECDLLDQLQEQQSAYSWGYTKQQPNGPL